MVRILKAKLFYILLATFVIVGLIILVFNIKSDVEVVSISFNMVGNMKNLGCLSVYVDDISLDNEYSFDNGTTWQKSKYGAIYNNGKVVILIRNKDGNIIKKGVVDVNSIVADAPIIRANFDAVANNKSDSELLKDIIALQNNQLINDIEMKKVNEEDNKVLMSYMVTNNDKKCYLLREMNVINNYVEEPKKEEPIEDKWVWPTDKPYGISRGYGPTKTKFHSGVDIYGLKRGSPIYAARNGEVVDIYANSSSGYYVTIKHDNGYYTRYAHMQNTNGNDKLGLVSSATKYVQVGQRVNAHDQIGEIGSSGNSTGLHLHFEIWDGKPFESNSYNPMKFYK